MWTNTKEKLSNENKIERFWQEELLSGKDKGNTILIAPTGSGKTEFALLWSVNQGRKLIYTLPLRVALNDIYNRFNSSKNSSTTTNIDLLHSTAFMEYLKEGTENKDPIDQQITAAKLFSNPLLLATPDQIFLTCLNFYGSDKIVGIYPLSSVVIDEIQAYDPDMASVIIKTLEIINKLCGKVLIITATFPPYFETFLNRYGYNVIDLEKEIVKNPSLKQIIKNYSRKRHKVKLIDEPLVKIDGEKSDISQELSNGISEKKDENILIIVNTVKKAISVYDKLKSSRGKDNIYLLHSRLLEKEKRRRIQEIKNKLNEKKKGIILVSTQIVEASVDIDFDVLYTEISPIDSQIQRWGRVYRNREDKGDYSGNNENIIIFTVQDKYTNCIYDKELVEKTSEVLQDNKRESVLDYSEERKLIEAVFSMVVDGQTLKEKYEKTIQKNIDNLDFFTVEKRSDAQRLFRKIAGQTAIFPQIMEKASEEKDANIVRALAKIIKAAENDITWEEIFKALESEGIIIPSDKKERNNFKWKIKEILYGYSINIPQYYIEKSYGKLFSGKIFKGFLVPEPLPSPELIKEFGLDKIKEDIDDILLEDNII